MNNSNTVAVKNLAMAHAALNQSKGYAIDSLCNRILEIIDEHLKEETIERVPTPKRAPIDDTIPF